SRARSAAGRVRAMVSWATIGQRSPCPQADMPTVAPATDTTRDLPTMSSSAPPQPLDGQPPPDRASDRIRERLVRAGRRYHANANIADFIEDGEIEALQSEVAEHMQQVLRSLVIDVEGDHNTTDTARRVAKMFVREVFSGRYTPMPA